MCKLFEIIIEYVMCFLTQFRGSKLILIQIQLVLYYLFLKIFTPGFKIFGIKIIKEKKLLLLKKKSPPPLPPFLIRKIRSAKNEADLVAVAFVGIGNRVDTVKTK